MTTSRPHTGRPSCAIDSVEQGLRDLAEREGPSHQKLASGYTAGLRKLMELAAAQLGENLSVHDRARAFLQFIYEVIASFDDRNHPKCKAALQAAFRLPSDRYDDPQYNSITSRLSVPLNAGAFDGATVKAGPEAGKRNWNRAVKHLASAIEDRIGELVPVGAWASTGPPSGYQPVRVRRLVVTYYLHGQTVTELVTERWIEALEDGVDKYVVRAYMKSDPAGHLEVHPLLNCMRGASRPVNIGPGFMAMKADIMLPKQLAKGETCFFATRVTRSESTTENPTWEEIQVTSAGIDSLIMRVQFDPSRPPPSACWYFAAVPDFDRTERPHPAERRDLDVSRCGYTERDFGRGDAAAKYGLCWSWD